MADPIIPRDERDAYVCAVALRAGLPVEVLGLWELWLQDGRCMFYRLPPSVAVAAALSRVRLAEVVETGKRIIESIGAALNDLYG